MKGGEQSGRFLIYSFTYKMNNKKISYLYLFITFFIWGSLYVVSKFVIGNIPVITVSFFRYAIAGISLFVLLKRKNVKKIESQDYKYIFLIGFVGYFMAIGLQLIGTKLSNASTASLINSMSPVAIMILAAVILKERLTFKKIVCLILAIVGVYVIIGGLKSGETLGIIVSLASVVMWSLVSVIVRKVSQKYDPLQITTYGIIIAAICTFPISIVELSQSTNVHFTMSSIISLIYMGIVCTAVAHALWNKSLSNLEAGTCSLFYPLQPMVSILLGIIFLGETITLKFILGALLITVGVLFSIVGKKNIVNKKAKLVS